jgi:hypothetical protein
MIVIFSLLLNSSPSLAQGKFTGRVAVEWLTGQTPERDMRLLEAFVFTDSQGKEWAVPAGAVVDGASIPQGFWSIAGSPFTGNYRRASVVHDYFCDQKTQPWINVHRMFFAAMIAGGVGELEAKIFYAAVYAGGPRWKTIITKNLEGEDEKFVIPQTTSVPPQVQQQTTSWILSENPSLATIEQRLDAEVIVH